MNFHPDHRHVYIIYHKLHICKGFLQKSFSYFEEFEEMHFVESAQEGKIEFMQDMRGSSPAPRTKGPREALRGNPASEGEGI